MARQRRIDIPNGIYHVISRGIDGKHIFRASADKQTFLICLQEALKKERDQCYAWAIMDNHVHLCIKTGEKPLAQLMRKTLTRYAMFYNRQYERHGYLFQNRYKSILCQEESYLQEMIRYIHLNPVRAGLISKPEELEKYPWTGHSALTGNQARAWQNTTEVLLRYSENLIEAKEKYKAFIAEGWKKSSGTDENMGVKRKNGEWTLPLSQEKWRGEERILGDDKFVSEVIKKSEENLSRKDSLKGAWTADRLIETICRKMRIKKCELHQRSRIKQLSAVRGVIAYLGCDQIGLNGAELARKLGISRPAISAAQKRGRKIVEMAKINLTF